MPVVTIRKRSKSQGRSLMMEAQQAANGLLESSSHPVLVVYDKEAANIYYDGPTDGPPRGPRRAA